MKYYQYTNGSDDIYTGNRLYVLFDNGTGASQPGKDVMELYKNVKPHLDKGLKTVANKNSLLIPEEAELKEYENI